MEAESIVPDRSPEPVDLVDPVGPVALVYLLHDMAVLEKLEGLH